MWGLVVEEMVFNTVGCKLVLFKSQVLNKYMTKNSHVSYNHVTNSQQEVQELQIERKSHLAEIQNLREKNLNLRNEVCLSILSP